MTKESAISDCDKIIESLATASCILASVQADLSLGNSGTRVSSSSFTWFNQKCEDAKKSMTDIRHRILSECGADEATLTIFSAATQCLQEIFECLFFAQFIYKEHFKLFNVELSDRVQDASNECKISFRSFLSLFKEMQPREERL